MRISALIANLQEAQKAYGDLPVTTFSGFIRDIRVDPARDGISYPLVKGHQNELSIEVTSE